MSSSSLRRLASDQKAIRQETPPNYLFPTDPGNASLPDDLTQLTILLTGAQGTPYVNGLWRLQLKMSNEYPNSPPKANFKTRIFHPNVDEASGAVCLETLKRDWSPKLTLKDILITISCLLIQPNPESALNATAGALLQEDYKAFAKQAKLMTSIHAPIPKEIRQAVQKAKQIGEDDEAGPQIEEKRRSATVGASSSNTSVIMKNKNHAAIAIGHAAKARHIEAPGDLNPTKDMSGNEEECDEAKENDPSQSPSPVLLPPPSPRKHFLGKRPLTELPTPVDPDEGETNAEVPDISKNQVSQSSRQSPAGRVRKSPKHNHFAGVNDADKTDHDPELRDGRDVSRVDPSSIDLGEEKENIGRDRGSTFSDVSKKTHLTPGNTSGTASARPTLRKVSNVGSARGKGQARTGLRRL